MGTITAAEYQRMMKGSGGAKKGRVRGTKKASWAGIDFDSTTEMRRYRDLWFRAKLGEITDLDRQVEIGLEGRDGPILTPTGRQMIYKADFTYREKGVLVIEDSKGIETDTFKMKKAILAAMGITVRLSGAASSNRAKP